MINAYLKVGGFQFTYERRLVLRHLLDDVVEHGGGEGVVPPDAQGLVEGLHGLHEVPHQRLGVADRGVGGGTQRAKDQGRLVI